MEDSSALNWQLLRQLAREKKLPIGVKTLDKIKSGHLRFTEDVSVEIHRITAGAIPCSATRPDIFAPGYIPPVLLDPVA